MSFTIGTNVKIEEDRRLVVQLPANVSIGSHRVVAVLDATPVGTAPTASGTAAEWTFPLLLNAQWPADLKLTREELYDDDGR